MKENKKISAYHIDYVSIDFVDKNLENGWTYIMGYDNFPLTSMEEKHKILTKAEEEKWIICFEHDSFIPAGKVHHTEKGFALAETVEL